jgi:hypothetical protein
LTKKTLKKKEKTIFGEKTKRKKIEKKHAGKHCSKTKIMWGKHYSNLKCFFIKKP